MRSSAQAYVNIACEHLSPLRTQTFVAQPANMGHDGASIGNSFKHWASHVPKRAFQKENCKAEVNKLISRADATMRKVPSESCQPKVSKWMCPNDPNRKIPIVSVRSHIALLDCGLFSVCFLRTSILPILFVFDLSGYHSGTLGTHAGEKQSFL